ncbi:MAG: hypothetical protein ABI863_18190 [Ginsengibacter sp.]
METKSSTKYITEFIGTFCLVLFGSLQLACSEELNGLLFYIIVSSHKTPVKLKTKFNSRVDYE